MLVVYYSCFQITCLEPLVLTLLSDNKNVSRWTKMGRKWAKEKVLGGVGYVCFNYMKKHGDNITQIDAGTGKTDTFDILLKRCVRTSIVLQQKGIAKGDIITYYSNIHLNACVPIIASFFIGAIPTFLDTVLPLSDITHLLKQVKPKFLLTSLECLNNIQSVIETAQLDTEVAVFDDTFFNYQERETDFKPVYVNDLEDVVAICFSSGSTGLSKGIILNHYRLLFCEDLEDNALWKKNERMVLFSQDSLYWCIEMARLISAIHQGTSRLISPKDLDANEIWYTLEKYKVNVAYLIPYDSAGMCLSGKPKDIHLTSLTTVVSEGGPLPTKYQLALQELLPNVDIFLRYGLTEVGLLTRFYKNDLHKEYSRRKLGSVGLPSLGYGIFYKVVDLETGKNLGPNQTGELRVKSKTVMKGYYNADSSNRFDEDGWLKTGDVVFYDEDYCFFVVNRIKEMIICKGWHITPASLEAELLTHPAVKKAVVIGVPHDQDREHPLGVVVLNNNINNMNAEEIEKYMHEKFPDRSMLRVRIVKHIPLTPSGKVKRQELKNCVLSSDLLALDKTHL